MNQRERYLALAVGGLLVAIVFQWGFSKYRGAVRARQTRLASLNNETQVLNERILAGAYADRQMGEYLSRSLPSDAEVARSGYQSWLLETVREHRLVDASVDPISEIPVGDLYRRFGYRVTGRTDLAGLIDLLHAIAARDTLHRVRELTFAPARTGDLSVEMAIDAIALDAASKTSTTPSTNSWRVAAPLADIKTTILNRNFFSPPNQPPEYRGREELIALRGQTTTIELDFADPEKTKLSYELSTNHPDWIRLDERSGKLIVTAPNNLQPETSDESESTEPDAVAPPVDTEPITLEVSVADAGTPRRQITQSLTVRLQDPPPPPPPAPIPPGFDDATQTYVSALLDGKEPMVWMNVRTRGETLKLRIGDEFKIGSISGKVVGMTSRAVRLEIDGAEYELRPATKLSDVTK